MTAKTIHPNLIPAMLESWRGKLSISKIEAARLFGVSYRTWRYWESGEKLPHPTLLRLAMSAIDKRLEPWPLIE